MRTFVELEQIIWRTSKSFVFGNPYNTVLAMKPEPSPNGLAAERLCAENIVRIDLVKESRGVTGQ
jgi:hypothetical protein